MTLLGSVGAASSLSARGITVLRRCTSGRGDIALVEGVDLDVCAGETVCVVGESGCGKSLTALALLGLTHRGLHLDPGMRVRVGDEVLGPFDGARWRQTRGRHIGLVYQDPLQSLDPLLTAGAQVVEPMEAHGVARGADAKGRALELLAALGLGPPERVFAAYPHELSGGMRQRVALAAALAAEPRVLVADEPTTALDPTVQAQLLQLLGDLVRSRGLALVLVTHDLGVVAAMADRLYTMYAGRIVEHGPAHALFRAPAHPYLRALLDARPRSGLLPRPIPGRVPAPERWTQACRFAPRCSRVMPQCLVDAPALEGDVQSAVACHHPWLADQPTEEAE